MGGFRFRDVPRCAMTRHQLHKSIRQMRDSYIVADGLREELLTEA
jgi:hypothetical protein